MDIGKTLAESENYILSHEFENCELVHKHSKNVVHVGDHFGDPTCGLIAPDETWCITGGEGLIVWLPQGKSWTGLRSRDTGSETGELQITNPQDAAWLATFGVESHRSVHDMKLESATSVRILLDPWSDYASVWLLDIVSKALTKLKDGPNLQDQAWTDAKIDF